MNASERSYRQILRSSAIIGGSSIVSVLVVIGKTKIAALWLGPTGVGLIGLFNGIVGTISAVVGLGIGGAGTRQIAEAAARGDGETLAAARRALFWATLSLASLGAGLVWLWRAPISMWVSGASTHADDIGWLGIGVALTVASSAQGAFLNGMRQIGSLARINVLGAVGSSALGITALLAFGLRGVAGFVIAAPLANFLLGHLFVARLPGMTAKRLPMRKLQQQWVGLARVGIPFMLAGLSTTGAQLFVRALVQRELGVEALGYFQASFTMGTTYLGFVLSAMGTDFYPRLTGAISDRARSSQLVNEQTEVTLLLAGPAIIAVLALAPWLTTLLYSASFAPAVTILRWQVLGDVLKIASWPLGFILLAAGDGRTYLVCEAIAMGTFALLSFTGVPIIGVEATGVAHFAMYAAYLPLVYWLGYRRLGSGWSRRIVALFAVLLLAAGATFMIASLSSLAAGFVGCSIAAALAGYALTRISKVSGLSGLLSRLNVKALWEKRNA